MVLSFFLSPEEVLLEKVRKGEIDPEDIDLEELIRDFRQRLEELSSSELMPHAGRFILAISGLLKLKVERFLGVKENKVRKKKVRLEEVLQVISEQASSEDPDWMLYEIKVGRPQGRKDTVQRAGNTLEESVPLHKEFRVEEYVEFLKRRGLYEFEELKSWLLSLQDRIERIRFLLAWLFLYQEHG